MKGILPDAVNYRKDKMGFVTHEPVWAKNELKALYIRELDDLPKHWGRLIGDKIKAPRMLFEWKNCLRFNFLESHVPKPLAMRF